MTNPVSEGPEDNALLGAYRAEPRYAQWEWLVDRIRRKDSTGLEELYKLLSKGIRYYLIRHIDTQEVDHHILECFRAIIVAIQQGELREPQQVLGFIQAVVNAHAIRLVGAPVKTQRASLRKPEDSAGQRVITNQQIEQQNLASVVLTEFSPRDQEILRRFYLQQESEARICAAMKLTGTQFRLLKSTAKARFEKLGSLETES